MRVKLKDLRFNYSTATVNDYQHTNTQISIQELHDIIALSERPAFYDDMQEKVKYALSSIKNDSTEEETSVIIKALKEEIRPTKNSLPFFMFSTTNLFGHRKVDAIYNGCIQIDVDFKKKGGIELANYVKSRISELDWVALCAISPSGCGLRVLVQTNAHEDNHLDCVLAANTAFQKQFDIDAKWFDKLQLNQPSFVSYDSEPYLNLDATQFMFDASKVIVTAKGKSKKAVNKYLGTFTPSEGQNYNHTEKQILSYCDIAYGAASKTNSVINTLFFTSFAGSIVNFGVELKDCIAYLELRNGNEFAPRKSDFTRAYVNYASTQFGVNIEMQKDREQKELEDFNLDKSNAIIIPEGKYLSDLKPNLSISASIVSPTASGKTAFIGTLTEKRVLVVRTAGLVEQVAEQYNAIPFYQYNKEIGESPDFIVTTYNSLNLLTTKIDASKYLLFIDEVQNYTISASKGFLLDTLNSTMSVIPTFKRFFTMTATPTFNFHTLFSDLKTIRYVHETVKDKNFTYVTYENRNATTKDICISNQKNNIQTVIYFNNKQEDGALGTLKAILRDAGLKVTSIDAEKKNTKEYNDIVVKGDMSDYDVVIATTVLKEGNSITKHSKHIAVILYTYFNAQEIEQATARFRKYDKLTVTILKSKHYEDSIVTFNSEYTKDVIIGRANAALQYNQVYLESQLSSELLNEKNTLTGRYCMIQNGSIVIDELSKSYDWFSEQTRIQNNNNELMSSELSKYSFKEFFTEKIVDSLSQQSILSAKEITASKKEEKILEINNLIDIISEETHDTNRTELEDTKLTSLQRDIRFKVSFISNYIDSDKLDLACKVLQDIGYGTSAFNKFKRAVRVQKLKTNSKVMMLDLDVIHFYKYMIESFKKDMIISSDEICEKMNLIRVLCFGDYSATYSKMKANQILQTFVSVKSVRVLNPESEGPKQLKKFVIENTNPTNLDINTDKYYEAKNELTIESLGDFFSFLK